MSQHPPVVAIDGPGSSGKGTLGLLLARKLECPFVDTGAMYRALAIRALQLELNLSDQEQLGILARQCRIQFTTPKTDDVSGCRVLIDGCDVTEQIRTPDIDMASSKISAYSQVHSAMVQKQRKMAQQGGMVMEGRDIGTVVLPDADIKFFLTASAPERARRRYRQMQNWGRTVDLKDLENQLSQRDRADSQRQVAPLRRAEDAIVLDTTDLSIEEALEEMLRYLECKLGWNMT